MPKPLITHARVQAWWPVVAFAGVIFFLSSRRWALPTGPNGIEPATAAHLVIYGVMATLIRRALLREGVTTQRAFWIGIWVVLLYGASDEIHQAFVPGRYADIVDLVVDVIGGAIGMSLAGVVGRARAKRRAARSRQLASPGADRGLDPVGR